MFAFLGPLAVEATDAAAAPEVDAPDLVGADGAVVVFVAEDVRAGGVAGGCGDEVDVIAEADGEAVRVVTCDREGGVGVVYCVVGRGVKGGGFEFQTLEGDGVDYFGFHMRETVSSDRVVIEGGAEDGTP